MSSGASQRTSRSRRARNSPRACGKSAPLDGFQAGRIDDCRHSGIKGFGSERRQAFVGLDVVRFGVDAALCSNP